jgi:ElaB/YqjD/DUF883 family membrane-anchored ribosome-binding protein
MENRSARPESQPGGQFAGTGQLKETARSAGSEISDTAARGRDAIGAAANEAANTAGTDLQSLRTDLNSLKDTVTQFMSETADKATKAAREMSSNVADRVSDMAGEVAQRGNAMASTATDQAKSLASELEAMARRNPIGALAGAIMVGIMIGMFGRRS